MENNELDKAIDLLSSWTASNHIDANYISYYNYYLRFKNGDDFSEQDIFDMYNLADKCPLTEGEIINAARSLYNFVTQDNLGFDDACGSFSAKGLHTTIKHKVKAENVIYPNPSKGTFSVLFASTETGRKQLKLTDIYGKIILEKTVASGESKAIISCKVSAGVYYLTISNLVSGKQEVKKVIIE